MKQSDLPYYERKDYYKFFNLEHNRKMWQVFFDYFNISHKILDFGCGAAWSIYFGREMGYDIVGLDTIGTGSAKDFIEFREATEVSKYVKLYGGVGRLPFDDNSFSLIVCRASFNKFNKQPGEIPHNIPLATERLNEFSRILTGPRIVVITGNYFKDQFLQHNFEIYNWGKDKITRLWKK